MGGPSLVAERVAAIVMGPSGCGKSTVGRLLADRLGAGFVEADDHHTDAARARMRAGRPLTDEERMPWIARVAAAARADPHPRVVIACSALSTIVRDALREGLRMPSRAFLLDVPAPILVRRLATRTGHFAGPSLLSSQLAALDPAGIEIVDGTPPPDAVALDLAARLGVGQGEGR